MPLRLLLGAFLVAHGLIHASFLSPRPPATAGGPAWPFELGRSWVLSPLGVDSDATRLVGTALIAVTIVAFGVAALAAVGLLPASLWAAAVVVGAATSIALLGIFFHPWLVLGLVIDLVLAWAALVVDWSPEGLSA